MIVESFVAVAVLVIVESFVEIAVAVEVKVESFVETTVDVLVVRATVDV